MSGGQSKAISKRLAEKDGGNDSEPELSTFSNLNISTKPLHTRPSRGHTKINDHQKTDVSPQHECKNVVKGDKTHRCKASCHGGSGSFNGASLTYVYYLKLYLVLVRLSHL